MTARAAAPVPPLPELESLLAPISAEAPAGESLRFDAVYREIGRLREEDDPTLPQGVWKRELKRADWPGVAALAAESLRTRSKDLQLAVWLTVAWTKMHGFAGLGHGLRLIAALCDAFWETLHPRLEEDGAEMRVAPVAWLSRDRFLFTVKCVPITAPASDEGVDYAWKDWELAHGEAEQAAVLVSASVTPPAFFTALWRDLDAAAAAVDALRALLVARLGEHDAPTLAPLRSALTDVGAFVARVHAEEVPAMKSIPQPPDSAPAAAAVVSTGSIASRADAYARLREASEYLLRTEPHSPVPYLVRRAVAWGNMSLAEVLEQLLQKSSELSTIYTLLGIKPTGIEGR